MSTIQRLQQDIGVQRFFFEGRFLKGGRISRKWGPTFRGGFGRALHRVSCSLDRDSCNDCALGTTCAYGYIYETPIPPSSTIMRKYVKAPHPFVFEPDTMDQIDVQEGDSFRAGLVVIGQAIRYLPYFFLALQELGRIGLGREGVPFLLEKVCSEEDERVYLYTLGKEFRQIDNRRLSLLPGTPREAKFTIRFQTPARIMSKGRITDFPSFLDIVKTLARRLFLLSHFHEDGEEAMISPAFLQAADEAVCLKSTWRWSDMKRFSSRQGRSTPLGGVLGEITCKGNLGILEPLLRAGEYVHVGKGTTFGLGRFFLLEEE